MWGSAYLDRNGPNTQSQDGWTNDRGLTTSSVHSIKKFHLLSFQRSTRDEEGDKEKRETPDQLTESDLVPKKSSNLRRIVSV
jgi:hypothetical protein